MSALRELFARFFVEADTKELEHANEKIEGFVGKLKEVGEGVGEAFAIEKLVEFTEGQVEAGAQLKNTSERLGTTTEELQALHLAAEQAGAGTEAIDTALRVLNRNLANASAAGSEQARTFRELGIATKNADGTTRAAGDVLGDLADQIASIEDPAKRTAIAMQVLGHGGAAIIPLLKRGGDTFREAREQMEALGGGLSDEFVEQADQAEAAQIRLNFALSSVKSRAAAVLLPVLERIVDWFTRLAVKATEFAKNTDGLSHAMQFFGAIAGARALQTVIHLAKSFGILKGSVLQTVGAMLRFAAPLLIIGLLYLAYDELATLLAGGDTLIGDALGPDKAAFVANLRNAVDELKSAFGNLGEAIGGDGTAMDAFGSVIVFVGKAMAYLVESINAVVKGLGWVVEKSATAGIALAKLLGARTGKETLGDSETGLTPEAEQRLASIGAAPDDLAPVSALGRKQRVKSTSESGQPVVPAQVPLAQVPSPYASFSSEFSQPKVTIEQTNTTQVDVHGVPTGDAKAVGEAVGAGVATAHQRANDRAITKYQQP